jgi:quercetin dioxygenase-like cupin family protein
MKRGGLIGFTAAVALMAVPLCVIAQKGKLPEQRVAPSEVAWSKSVSNLAGSGLQPGIETVYVAGDGTKAELYSMEFRIAPHTTIQPHSHPDDRSCFVLSGLWYFGYGTIRDESKMRALPPGSNYTEPGGVVHFAGTKTQGVTLECTAVGPTGTTMFKASDDPRIKK